MLNQTSHLVGEIEKAMQKNGIMFRVFFREKNPLSLKRKIEKEPGKYGKEKKIQDIVGIRIALYFLDDVQVAKEVLCKKFTFSPEDSQIDTPASESFKATRCNLIFKLPDNFDLAAIIPDEYKELVDNTFEVQLRTILSEGWHEVDHDLRYKCKDDWRSLKTENRALNGVYATLETSEWTLLKLFEDLAYTHYKSGNWRAMIQNKFRLRILETNEDEFLTEFIYEQAIAKQIFRYERSRLFECLSIRGTMPITIKLIIYIINLDKIKDPCLISKTPDSVIRWWHQT